jgi:hypothetical protein
MRRQYRHVRNYIANVSRAPRYGDAYCGLTGAGADGNVILDYGIFLRS